MNYIIGFDMFKYNMRIMEMEGNADKITVHYVPFDPSLGIEGNFYDIVNNTLLAYFENKPFKQSSAVYLVLPNNLIAIDLFSVPTLKRAQTNEALTSAIVEMYKNEKDLIINRNLVSATKTTSSFNVISVQRMALVNIYKALSLNKLYVKSATFAASNEINAAFALNVKCRKKSFILADIKADNTILSVCNNGVCVGFKELPFGYKILESDKIVNEYMLYDNDLAFLAVVNATEKAKQKKLSASVNLDDDEDATDVIEENAISVNENFTATHENTDLDEQFELADDEVVSTATEKVSTGKNALESAANISCIATTIAKEPVVKQFQKKPKRMPQYMLRPVPETHEEMVVENFRIFLKHILLIALHNHRSKAYEDCEFALVSMPKKYAYVVEKSNNVEENGLELKYLAFDSKNDFLRENLDLYGATFMNLYNKVNNF